MSSSKASRSCLVVSYGPIPTPQYQKIEGGGMRAWGLAKGLHQNGVDVTVAVNASFPQDFDEIEDIRIANWGKDQAFIDLANSHDAVIMSYCMGDDSPFLASRLSPDVQLILDTYVPIYVEVSARDSKDIAVEYQNYARDIQFFNKSLLRGDYFICASDIQKTFYTGVLSPLGIINPRSYREDRIKVIPFGIHSTPLTAKKNPYIKLGIKSSDKVVLWFGGIYPWFHIEDYLDAISELVKKHKDMKFVFVGGRNPFNPNPDFSRQYEKTYAFAKENKHLNKQIYFVDWVDFDTRDAWYIYADFVVSLNQPGEENGFSWRTRVMDYVWGEVVTVTNGGDPLSEYLISKNAAIRLPELSRQAIVATINELYSDKNHVKTVKQRLVALKLEFYWENITKPLQEIITEKSLPYKSEQTFRSSLNLGQDITSDAPANRLRHLALRSARLPIKAARHTKKYGLKNTTIKVNQRIRSKLNIQSKNRQFIFLSHPVNNTGAPLILLKILEEVIKQNGNDLSIKLLAPHVDATHLRALRAKGIRVDRIDTMGNKSIIDMQLRLAINDIVFINTIAVNMHYILFIFDALESGRLKQAFWFVHEDVAQIPVISPSFGDPAFLQRLAKLIDSRKLHVAVPTKRVAKDYKSLIGSNKIEVLPYQVNVPNQLRAERAPGEYNRIDFFLSGTAVDGRKGQFIALNAFSLFLQKYQSKHPKKYRQFSLNFVALGDDFISQQIKTLGTALLGKNLKIHPSLPRSEALEVTRACNAVICCSLNETFALYVAEGMAMGHIVLRNNSAGMEEQLQEGVNGFYIDSDDVNQFAEIIEKLLNKENYSDKELQAMGIASQKIIKPYLENTYLGQIQKSLSNDD